MNPEHWQQIEQLYHAALEREPDQRGRFIAEACADDTALRTELESLLAQDLAATDPLDSLARESALNLLEDVPVARLEPEAQLGPYRIETRIGVGGWARSIVRGTSGWTAR